MKKQFAEIHKLMKETTKAQKETTKAQKETTIQIPAIFFVFLYIFL
jgi:hypothetical protein